MYNLMWTFSVHCVKIFLKNGLCILSLVIECAICHNYAQYIDHSLYKEEFYFDSDNLVVVADLEYFIVLDSNDKFLIECRRFSFSTQEQLLSKIKTYIFFS